MRPHERWSDEETFGPIKANDREFSKDEKWTKDDTKVDRLLYAGSNLGRPKEIFAKAISHRPRIRVTIRQRTADPDAGRRCTLLSIVVSPI